jgi:alpha-glucoside transport system permease protein
MTSRLGLATACTIGFPLLLLGWLWVAEQLEGLLPLSWRTRGRAFLWLLPPGALVGVYLVWPLLTTVWLTFRGSDTEPGWTLANVRWLGTSDTVRAALANNVLWVAVLVVGCVLLGLVVAVLADGTRYEALAKAVVVAPVAISFVCGAIVWGFVYDFQAPGLPQVGTLNAVWADGLGQPPVAWLVDRSTNNLALIAIGVWSTLGFATVIISAAVKGVPDEILDAARVDGAGAWQRFRHIVLPQVRPTLVVVATLVGIMALKAFDIVYVLTNGNYGTDVIANVLYEQLFIAQSPGRASAVALLLTLVALPLFVVNALVGRNEAER